MGDVKHVYEGRKTDPTRLCVTCTHSRTKANGTVPPTSHYICLKFREPLDPVTGHKRPRRCSDVRRATNNKRGCEPEGLGWEAKGIPWWKCLDFWNWPPPGGGPDPLRDNDDPGGIR
jgi:hypothetical protein